MTTPKFWPSSYLSDFQAVLTFDNITTTLKQNSRLQLRTHAERTRRILLLWWRVPRLSPEILSVGSVTALSTEIWGPYREQEPSPEETRLPDGMTESAVGQASLSAKPWSPKLSCSANMWAVAPSSTPLQVPKKMAFPFLVPAVTHRQLPNAVSL